MMSPWKEKMMIRVSKSPKVVMPLNLGRNFSLKYSMPFFFIIKKRVSAPPASGTTTNNTIEKKSVSQGIVTPFTPNKSCTSGTNSTRISRSFTETCTSVCAGSPLVRWLHTNTIAVQGATPNNTAPVTKSCARPAGMKDWKMTLKNRVASPNIKNGLISQLLPVDMRIPKGFFLTFLMDWKSIFIIMGKIIIQMSTAMGRFCPAYWSFSKTAGMPGRYFPIRMPAAIIGRTAAFIHFLRTPCSNFCSLCCYY